jgi:hypothetical protein
MDPVINSGGRPSMLYLFASVSEICLGVTKYTCHQAPAAGGTVATCTFVGACVGVFFPGFDVEVGFNVFVATTSTWDGVAVCVEGNKPSGSEPDIV